MLQDINSSCRGALFKPVARFGAQTKILANAREHSRNSTVPYRHGAAVERAMAGHIVARAELVGMYRKTRA